MNLAVLKAEARATAKRQQDRLQKAIDENRELTAEEETADANDKATLARLTAQIQRAEEAMTAAAAIGAAPAQTPPATAPPVGTVPAQPRAALDTGGFRDMAEFAQAVRCANPAAGQGFRMDDRLAAPTNVHMEGGDEMGSYLVPPEFPSADHEPRLWRGQRSDHGPDRARGNRQQPRRRPRRRDDAVVARPA